MAFKMAGIFGFKKAMCKTNPILREPIMAIDLATPGEYHGDIVGDLSWRRRQIQEIEAKNNLTLICAFVRLEIMFGHATDIRSSSKGRATFIIESSHFEQVPASFLAKIIENSTGNK
jgi:elongation factor G